MLSSCLSAPSHPLPINCAPMLLPKTGFGSAGSNKFSHGQVLCPTLVAIQNASCETLASPGAVAELLTRVAAEPLCCKVGWAGMQQGARELALLLVKLGRTVDAPRGGPLRVVAIHAGHAWLTLVVVAYMPRVHDGGALHGLLVGDGKSEWMHANDVRILMRQAGLSYRMTAKFEPLAELALLSVNPAVNRLIMPVSFTPAKAILPRRWAGSPSPFALCLRVGKPLDDGVLLADFERLGPFCSSFAFWSGHGSGRRADGEQTHNQRGEEEGEHSPYATFLTPALDRVYSAPGRAQRAGNWTVVTGMVRPETLRFVNDYEPPPVAVPPPKPIA